MKKNPVCDFYSRLMIMKEVQGSKCDRRFAEHTDRIR